MCFINLALLNIFTEWFLDQKTEYREISKKLWDILNTGNLKNALHLISNVDLEYKESAMTNEIEAELMMS